MHAAQITASIVVFYPDLNVLRDTVVSTQKSSPLIQIVIVDNANELRVRIFSENHGCIYISTGQNIGFGSAHNIAIQKYATLCKYFLILNPDVEVDQGCLVSLMELMEKRNDIVLSAPKVLNPDGSLQRVHKRLPSLKVLMGRRFFPRLFLRVWPTEFYLYELKDLDMEKSHIIPSVSGCFMLFKSTALLDLKGFDERFFMYQEDIDLSRRAHALGQVVYWPSAKITHLWARGSHKKLKLTIFNIVSVLKYFWKWGLSKNIEPKPFQLDS